MRSNKRKKNITEKLVRQTRKLLEEKGRESLEIAKKLVLEERIECGEIREALQYFMKQYWQDLTTPTLLSLSCEAVGGNSEDIKSIAVPLIMISGAIDIHDDIVDRSKTKDNRATVVGKFGEEIALIVGDFLLGNGFILLNDACGGISNTKFSLIMENIKNAFSELADAESLEILLQRKKAIKPHEYLHVVRKKAADIEGLMKVGAITGGGSAEEIKALGKYGRCLGTLSILRDDLIDLMDFKELRHRIRYECLPFPLLYTLRNTTVNSVMPLLSVRKKKDVNSILDAVEKGGGFKHCKKVMQDIAKECYIPLKIIKHNKKYLTLLVDTMLTT
jgi:geranylgeranyl diphosphate synthase type I